MLRPIVRTSRLQLHAFPPPVRLSLCGSRINLRNFASKRPDRKSNDTASSRTESREWKKNVRHSSAPNSPQTDDVHTSQPLEQSKEPPYHDVPRSADLDGSHQKSTDPHNSDEETRRRPKPDEPQEPLKSPEQEEGEVGNGMTGPLPDLREGIPSTLAAELRRATPAQGASRDSLNITEDPGERPAAGGGGGRGGEGLPRSEYISSGDRKKNALFKTAYAGIFLGTLAYTVYLGRNWATDEEEKSHPDAPSGWGPLLFSKRVKARLLGNLAYYNDPVTTKLLPDEDKDPDLRFPFVLVVSLEDMLIHEEWTREHGWRVAKRPGVDYFLRYLSQYYEIVLFTSKPYALAEQVDLSYLNRPMRKILMIDTDPHHAKHQPENAVILPPWKGDPNDQTLVQLIPFLEYLATMGLDDVRPVLKSFEGKYIPAEFARREKLLRQKFESQQAEKRPRRSLGLGSLFSTRNPNPEGLQRPDEAAAEGKMIWDQIRERGQKNYELLEKRIREEGDKFLADQAAEQKRLEEEAMQDMKKGFKGFFGRFAGSGEANQEK